MLNAEQLSLLDQASRSEAFLETLRAYAKRSLYFLTKSILGFHKLTNSLHLPLSNHIQDLTIPRKLLLMPRGHYKTTCGSIGFIVWLLIQDKVNVFDLAGRELRILLAKENATLAEHDLSAIEGIFDTNMLFKTLFPNLIPDPSKRKRWNAEEMLLNRESSWPEATVETIGVGGAKQGTHYDVIIFDDIIGDKAKESETIMDSTIEWFKYAESLFISPVRGVSNVLGTRWSKRDVYQFILDKDKRYKPYIRGAVEEGKPIFPEEFTLDLFDDMRLRDLAHYSSQYCNNPTDPTKCDFRQEWLKLYTWELDSQGNVFIKFEDDDKRISIREFDIVGCLDPSIDEKPNASRRAIVYVGMDSKQRVVVLDYYASRDTTDKLLEALFKMHEKWSGFNLRKFGVEAVALSKVYIPLIEKEAQLRKYWISCTPVTVSSFKSKDSRIRDAWQQVATQGRLYRQQWMREFDEEFIDFPQGRTKDVLDAGAHCVNLLQVPESLEDQEENERLEERFERERSSVTGY